MIGVLNDRMARYPGVAAHDHTGGGRVVGEYGIRPEFRGKRKTA